MDERLIIGEILKPQGIIGEIKVKPYVDDEKRFYDLKRVFIAGVEYSVLRARVSDAVYLILKGVSDRNTAELLRGKFLEVEREDAVELPEGNYFVVDVLGSSLVTDEDTVIGTVIDINTSARKDIYTVKCVNGKIMRFPLLKDLLISIDVANKKVKVFAKRLGEVSVYED